MARLIGFIIIVFVVSDLHAADMRRIKNENLLFDTSVALKKTITKKISGNINFYRSQLKDLKQQRTLNRQLKDERLIIKKIFNAYGFYDAVIHSVIVNTDKKIALLQMDQFNDFLIQSNRSEAFLFKKKGYRIAYQFKLGKVYRIKKLEFNGVLELAGIDKVLIELYTEGALRAQNVLDAFELIKLNIAQNQCFVEGKLTYDVQLDTKKNEADIEFNYDETFSSFFKSDDVVGLSSINNEWLIAQMGLKRNKCLNKSKINNAILKLYATNLLARVSYTLEKAPAKNGTQSVIIHLNVIERKHRTIAAGGGLSTSQGAYLSGSWQHRNVFEKAEQINVESFVGSFEQLVSSEMIIPRIKFYDFGLSLRSQLHRFSKDENVDFEWVNKISLFKKINKYTVYNGSLKLSTKLKIQDKIEQQALNQLYFPNFITWDERDDIVNSTHGIYVQAGVTPVWDIKNMKVGFIDYHWVTKGFYTFKYPLPITLALKYEGQIIDVKQASLLPADERLYLGGGSDMRGFAFESINANENGGVHSSVFSFETRFRMSETIGFVAFYDVGYLIEGVNTQTNTDTGLNTTKNWYSAAGVGFRYYTSFFPIRVDVALPIQVFDVETAKYQFYISIGQSY